MNEIFGNIKKTVSKEQRLSFISTFLIGVIVHMFMLSNKIPNHDDVGQLYDSLNRPKSGRWFLFFPSKISSELSLPWFNGVLGILYISLCTMLLIRLFQLKSSICIITISALMITFPTIASTFNYMQAGDSYFFCMLLTCIAVYFVSSSSKLCWIAAIVCLTLSLGIYQAYLPFAVALLVILHIKGLLIENKDVSKILLSGIKSISIIGISVVAYLIITKLVLKYQNAALAGHIAGFVLDDFSAKNILRLVLTAYKRSLSFYIINELNIHYIGMNYLYILMFVIALAFSILLFKKYNQEKYRVKIFVLMFLYAVLPLAAGLIYCMCAQVHVLMIYGFVVLLLFPLILTDWVESSGINAEGIKGNLICLGQILIMFILFITSFNYALVSNKAYLSLYLTYEQSYAYSNRLMTEIQALDEFDKNDKIVMIGYPILDLEYTMPWLAEKDVQSLRGVTPSLTNQYTFDRFLKYYLGVEQEVSRITSLEQLERLGTDIDINELSCYPDAGSIACEEDIIFVKFSDVR